MRQTRWLNATRRYSLQVSCEEFQKPLRRNNLRELHQQNAEHNYRRLDEGTTEVLEEPFILLTKPCTHTSANLRKACTLLSLVQPASRSHVLSATSPSSPFSCMHSRRAFHMSSPFSAEAVDDKLFELSQAPEHVIRRRLSTIRRTADAIKSEFGKTYEVHLFGSTCYGVDSATSDLDLSLFDPVHPRGFVYGQKPPRKKLAEIYSLDLVVRALKKKGFKKVQAVRAKVPIVKFYDSATQISCDMNINERLGYCNSQMFKQYCTMSPTLREVAITIKQWAKPLGLNNPSGAGGPRTFSSYALTLMTVALFQQWHMLPNLQQDLPAVSPNAKHLFWTSLTKDARPRDFVPCDVRFHVNLGGHKLQEMSVRSALMAWFKYWAREHMYEGSVISIRDGGILPLGKFVKNLSEQRKITKSSNKDTRSGEDTSKIDDLAATAIDTVEEHNFELQAVEAAEADEDDLFVDNSEEDRGPSEFDVPINPHLPETLQPIFPQAAWNKDWKFSPLLVADPFIVSKNVASGIVRSEIERFKDECMWAYAKLHSGRPIDELLLRQDSSVKEAGKPLLRQDSLVKFKKEKSVPEVLLKQDSPVKVKKPVPGASKPRASDLRLREDPELVKWLKKRFDEWLEEKRIQGVEASKDPAPQRANPKPSSKYPAFPSPRLPKKDTKRSRQKLAPHHHDVVAVAPVRVEPMAATA